MSYIPDYKLAAEKAIEVLEDSDITQAPIVLREIIRRYSGNIKVIRYSKIMKNYGLSLPEVIHMFDSSLGACAFDPSTNHFIIYYNDSLSTDWCRFTVAHELGHIFLEHHQKAGSSILSNAFLSKEDYDAYEKEANVFARNLLSPAPLALNIIDDNAPYYEKLQDLQLAFSITEAAADTRLDYIHRDLQDYNEDMEVYVSTIRMNYDRTCSSCHSLVPHRAKYCITCGSQSIYKSFQYSPLPAYIRRNHRGIFEHCVQCGNNEITPGTKYCKICGAPVMNYCTGNKNPEIKKQHMNPSTALFCGACGSRTFFNIYNIKLSKEEVPAMRYSDGVEYDLKTLRVKICPRCNNEEFSETAKYCRICGTALYNYCEGGNPVYDNSGQELIEFQPPHKNPSNARYCETCGLPTDYYKNKILPDYTAYQQAEQELYPIDYEHLPFK